MGQFHRILHCLQQFCGIVLLHQCLFLLQDLVEGIATVALVHQHFPAFLQVLQEIRHGTIFLHLHLLGLQVMPGAHCQSFFLDEENGLLLGEKTVRHGHRIAFHIAAPYIIEPHQVVQLRQQKAVSTLFLHLIPHGRQLLLHASSCDFLVQLAHFPGRESRPVCPYGLCQVPVIDKFHLLVCQLLLIAFPLPGGNDPAIESQGLSFPHVLPQKLLDGGHPFIHHAEQFHPGALQFSFCLDKVTTVCPESGPLLPYQKCTVGTGKIAEIFPHLEVVIHILRMVEIRCRHHIEIHTTVCHLRPEGF